MKKIGYYIYYTQWELLIKHWHFNKIIIIKNIFRPSAPARDNQFSLCYTFIFIWKYLCFDQIFYLTAFTYNIFVHIFQNNIRCWCCSRWNFHFDTVWFTLSCSCRLGFNIKHFTYIEAWRNVYNTPSIISATYWWEMRFFFYVIIYCTYLPISMLNSIVFRFAVIKLKPFDWHRLGVFLDVCNFSRNNLILFFWFSGTCQYKNGLSPVYCQ